MDNPFILIAMLTPLLVLPKEETFFFDLHLSGVMRHNRPPIQELNNRLINLEKTDLRSKLYTIHVNSPGGDITVEQMLVDRIERLKDTKNHVFWCNVIQAASAAAMFLKACDVISVTEKSEIMFHEVSYSNWSGKKRDFILHHIPYMDEQDARWLSKHEKFLVDDLKMDKDKMLEMYYGEVSMSGTRFKELTNSSKVYLTGE